MASQNRNSKITRYRRPYSVLNIGTIIFGFIFLYMVISVFLYMTAEHTVSYEVMEGAISGNYRYTALALKEETIVPSSGSGSVVYYAREGAMASSGTTVCSVGGADMASAAQAASAEPTAEDLKNLKDTMSSFLIGFEGSTFQEVYNFKADLESYILQMGKSETDTALYTSGDAYVSPESGFVVYSVDGLEDATEEELSADLFSQTQYHRTNLRLSQQVSAGDPLYKLVTSEEWALYFPLDSSLATELQDRSSIRFRFLMDNNTFSAPFSIIQNESGYYGKISLNTSLARYVSDRYLEIELLMDRKTGLKIPTSAIAEKTFYRIPEEYVIANKDTEREITLLRETFNRDGSASVRYVTATVYGKEEGYYLVSPELFEEGDYVQMLDTNKKFQIQESNMDTIQGVYNINKGYAVFREVTVIDENEEFCIVEPDNVYSLAAHDHIVLDASTVNDDDIVY